MFQRVYFAPRKASMKIFADIAANSAFALNVKELIYDGRLFLPELGTFASCPAAFRARMVEELDIYEDHTRNAIGNAEYAFADEVYQGSIWNMEKLGAGDCMNRVIAGDGEEYHTNVANSSAGYVRLLDQQDSILKKGKDFKALCEGLKSFRNISKIGVLADFVHYSNYLLCADDRDDEYVDCHEWYSSQTRLEFGFTVPPSR